MTHRQRHRGAHPEDGRLFADAPVATLRVALQDYCWLLSRGYAVPSSLKLVGDKFQLEERQRMALMRAGCSDNQLSARRQSERLPANLGGSDLFVDGFNLLITVESALSGGILFVGRDGCYRDLASIHSTYKRVDETHEAIRLVGATLEQLGAGEVTWFLDQPVSNSGRLASTLREVAAIHSWNWKTELCPSPDRELKRTDGTIVTTDSAILDVAKSWLHLAAAVTERHLPGAHLMDLRPTASELH